MPYRDPERQRAFQRTSVAQRRAAFLTGKACVDCGSTERLELDHVDPAQKVDHRVWSWSQPRLHAELAKCVIRCRACHQARHSAERTVPHGSAGYKRGCRCEVCSAWKQAATDRERARRGRGSNAPGRLCRPLPNHSATPPGIAIYSKGATQAMSHLLIANRTRAGEPTEAEPVLVDNHDPRVVVLELDDGERLELDRVELAAALADREAA